MDTKFLVKQLEENIWQLNESDSSGQFEDAYLVIGENEALVIDALLNYEELYERVREITTLPVKLLITHGHPDHAGKAVKAFADAAVPIYMDKFDKEILTDFCRPYADKFIDIYPGMKFDIGRYCFEAISMPGHTAGSVMFFDENNKLLFSGDAIGSGHFWMQLPMCQPMKRLADALDGFYEIIKDIPELSIYPGHLAQSPVPLNVKYINDVRTVARGIVNGTMVGKADVMDFIGNKLEYSRISYGMMANFCYDPEKIIWDRDDSEIGMIRKSFREEILERNGRSLHYMLFEPKISEGEKYPLVLFLHGAGERGSNTPIVLYNSGAINFADPNWQEKHPCYIIAPQCPDDESWVNEDIQKLLMMKISSMPEEYPVDVSRIYVTGLSMGGFGTWSLISRYPEFFAAAMPVCGGGDPFTVKNAKHVPVWAFHAADDSVVPVTDKFLDMDSNYGTRKMVVALRSAGNRNVKYTEYPAGFMNREYHSFDHCSWIPAYEDREALEWLFSQTRFDKYETELVMPGVWYIEDFNNDSMYLVEGAEKALLIDTGLGGGNLKKYAESLTHLPVELAVTHAHGDHMAHSFEFERFYMSKKDIPVYEFMKNGLMPGNTSTADDVDDIKSGDIIKLGGGVDIEVFEVGGHTPGSVVFIDRYHGLCFTGDALGLWMQVPYALPISQYRDYLIAFKNKLESEGISDIVFMGGHRRQEGGNFTNGYDYHPAGIERVDEMIELCDLILNDEIESKPYPRSFDEPALIAEYRSVYMVYKNSIKH